MSRSPTKTPFRLPLILLLAALALAAIACNLPGNFSLGQESNNLEPGGQFIHSLGVLVGDPGETLGERNGVAVTIAEEAPALPAEVEAAGQAYLVQAERDELSAPETSFLVGLPLPDDATLSNFAIAQWVSPESIIGADPTGHWEYFESFYDEEANLLLAALPKLRSQGTIVRIVQGDQFNTAAVTVEEAYRGSPLAPMTMANVLLPALNQPGTNGALTNQSASSIGFQAVCDPDFPDDVIEQCRADVEIAAAEADLHAAYTLYNTNEGFLEPSLYRPIVGMQRSGSIYLPVFGPYQMTLKSCTPLQLGQEGDNPDKGGEYNLDTKKAWVCIGSSGYDETRAATLRHEYFHAIQNSYIGGHSQVIDKWVIEGQATVAMFWDGTSYDRRIDDLLPIDASLVNDPVDYTGQDFWIYYGSSTNIGLSYLDDIMGFGPKTADVDQAIQQHGAGFANLGDAYWAFVKNQSFEKSIEFDGIILGNSCSLSNNRISLDGYRALGLEDEDPVSDLNPITYQLAAPPDPQFFTLEPLSSTIIELTFEGVASSPYMAQIEVESSSTDIQSHFYDRREANSTDCQGTPDSNQLSVSVPTGENRRYHLLVSNTSISSSRQFQVLFPNQGEGFHILEPTAGATFTEADEIPLTALATGIGDPDITFSIDWIVDRYRVDAGGVVTTTFANSDNGETILYDGFCDGQYTITAKALLPSGGPFTDTVTFNVTDLGETTPPDKCAPSIQIESPADNTNYSEGETIEFSASIEDDHFETDEPIYDVSWFLGGEQTRFLGSGLSLSEVLEPGFYKVEARYGAARDFADIFVVGLDEGEEPNQPPTVTINSPDDGDSFQENGNVPVSFSGTASDPEDGQLTGSDLVWEYRQGSSGAWQSAGQGNSTTITFPGSCNWVTYQIRLTAEDSAGRSNSAFISISARGPAC